MTMDNNTIKTIIFGSLIIIGIFASFLMGHSTSEIGTVINYILIIAGGAGLMTTDKLIGRSGGNGEGNEKIE